jgi:hypothetical protein
MAAANGQVGLAPDPAAAAVALGEACAGAVAEAAAGDAAVAGAAVADAVVGDAVVGDAAAACDELLHPPSARQSAGTIAISNVTGTRDLDIGILSWADCFRGTIAPHPATLERMLIAVSMRPYSRWNWLLACVTTPSVGAASRVKQVSSSGT